MATIEVRRARDLAGVFRRVAITCDGDLIARLRPNGQAVVTIAPGSHTLQASIDRATRPIVKVDLAADEHVVLTASLPWAAGIPLMKAAGTPFKSPQRRMSETMLLIIDE